MLFFTKIWQENSRIICLLFDNHMAHTCDLCHKTYTTLRGLNIHCSRKHVNISENNQILSPDIIDERINSEHETLNANIEHENEIYPDLPTFKPMKHHPDKVTA
jgi:hypothetical protein